MKTLVEVHAQSGSNNTHPIDASWSSKDETDFIRYLRDRGAYQALEQYASVLARKNVYVYTAAISSLAGSKNRKIRKRAMLLLNKMDEAGVVPSSFTFAALFQSVDGPEEARKLMAMLQAYAGKTTWSTAAFNQAIMACSRRELYQKRPTNKSWQVALEFLHSLRAEGLSPDWKTYTALLYVCAQTGQLRIALSLAREIESNPDIAGNSRVWGALLNVCAQAGDYKQANEVLIKMQEGGHNINLADCSAFLKALSRNGLVKLSFEVLDQITGSNLACKVSRNHGAFTLQLAKLPRISPDLVALNTVVASCAKAKDFDSARKLLDCMNNGEFCDGKTRAPIYPDEISYSLLLSSCREPLAAREIVKEMQLSRRYRVGVVRPSNITYARAIAVCSKADVPDVESARFFLSSARSDGVEPTVFMYSAAIWTAERSGNYSFAKEILEEMKAEDVEPNSISYTGVISTAARAGRLEEAMAVYSEFKKCGGAPSAATYNALAMALRQSQTPKKLEVLESIFEGMKGADRFVDVGGPVIEALINEYGRHGAYSEAERVFDMINGPANGPCLRAILNACATADPEPRWEEAVSILHSSDITLNAIGPGHTDQEALGNAMIACSKADRWQEGLNLLLLYGVRTKRHHCISTAALNSVIAACGRGGRPDAAVSILNEMEKRYGVKPDGRSYRSAVIACNQAEHMRRRHQETSSTALETTNEQSEPSFQWWECSLALLRRMKEDGLKPDIQTLSSCISACEAAGQWQRALGVLQSMIDENSDDEQISLNLFCFNAAISACEKGGAWVEALEIYERMISYGGLLQPNFVTLSALVLALSNAGQKELAESKYEEGVTMKIVNPWRVTKDARGQRVRAMDLHNFNVPLACSAVRSHVNSLLRRGSDSIEDDLIIIVGKGLRSDENGVKLLPAIRNLWREDYGVSVEADKENSGRLVVGAKSLRTLVAGRSWGL